MPEPLPPAGPMELLLLRHGIAEERAPDRPDRGRRLTRLGRERSSVVLQRIVAMGLVADQLVSSPLIRARETAELAVAAGFAAALVEDHCLAPGADPLPLLRSWWATAASGDRSGNRLALVGHEPDLGLLACQLIGAVPGALSLKKAGLALLRFPAPGSSAPGAGDEFRPGGARLKLLLCPRFLVG